MKEDPYETLACKIFARYTDKDLKRLFEDPLYLRQIILDELWDTDFTGIIFQHEFDHLRGILYTDKLYETSKD